LPEETSFAAYSAPKVHQESLSQRILSVSFAGNSFGAVRIN